MAVTFGELLTRIQRSIGDPLASTYSRTDDIWPWAIEAIREFPIGKPSISTIVVGGSATYRHTLPADYQDIITVEYPISQDPIQYLQRKNHSAPGFFSSEYWYDIDRDYPSSIGWLLWTSKKIPAAASIKVEYLASHRVPTDELDDLDFEERHTNILTQYAVWRVFVERLGRQMLDSTAHTSTIQQMKDSASSAYSAYQSSLNQAILRATASRTTPSMQVDKFDRVY